MSLTGKITCGCIWLTVFLCLYLHSYAQSQVQSWGIGPVVEENIPKAEQRALQDAFSKAILQVALSHIPASSSLALVEKIQEYNTSRETQDISQYQITSRSRFFDVLQLNVDVIINDDYLKNWLQLHALTTPYEMRPAILLMISSYGPGSDETYEWWTSTGKRPYSRFENQLAEELKRRGEKVLYVEQIPRNTINPRERPLFIAASSGADLLLTGSISYTPVHDTLYETTFDVNLLDVQKERRLASWTLSRRSDFEIKDVHTLIISSALPQIQSHITQKILDLYPVVVKRHICINGISDYRTYQSMITALNAMAGISSIKIVSIQGHTICHSVEIKGSLEEMLQNLQYQQIADADIMIEGDVAYIRILKR